MSSFLEEKLDLLIKGAISREEFLKLLKDFPFSSQVDIKLDFSRSLRRGTPEVIYGQGKSVQQLSRIVKMMADKGEDLIVTRVSPEKWRELEQEFGKRLLMHAPAGVVTWNKPAIARFSGRILVVSAGAADESVAEEACVTAAYLGNPLDKEYDMGVACLARILSKRGSFEDYVAIIVVAGMEGALPSVIAGLTPVPVIAVPTSQGYGANLNGVAALLAMLNSCAGGIAVVNIDSGFQAAFFATLLNQRLERLRG